MFHSLVNQEVMQPSHMERALAKLRNKVSDIFLHVFMGLFFLSNGFMAGDVNFEFPLLSYLV